MQVNLVFLKKDGTTSRFELPSTVTSIGRRQDCDFCIPLMVVSRRHCEINLDAGKITVRDLGSRNGTFVNGEPVEEAQVKPGDILKIGPIEFVVQVDDVPSSFENYLQKDDASAAAAAAAQQARVQAYEPDTDDNFGEAIDDLGAELGGSHTELHSELADDFNLDEEFNL